MSTTYSYFFRKLFLFKPLKFSVIRNIQTYLFESVCIIFLHDPPHDLSKYAVGEER